MYMGVGRGKGWRLQAAYFHIGVGREPDAWNHLSGFNTKDHRDPQDQPAPFPPPW